MTPLATFKFRLYIAGDAQNSVQAQTNLNALCKEHLFGRYDIEIVDVFREPRRAMLDGIFITPTLVKLEPSPTQRLIGSLSDPSVVLLALGVAPTAS